MFDFKEVKVLKTVRVADGTVLGREIIAGTDDKVLVELFDDLRDGGYVGEREDAAAPAGGTVLLAKLKKDELEAYALEHGINVSAAKTKDDLLAVIEAFNAANAN